MELKVGDPAPEFELPSDQGTTLKLADLRGKRVILYFYPKDDTPGCTKQACGFRDAYPIVEARNTVVLGVSPDSVKSHQKFKTKFNLPFTLLADQEHKVAELYGVWVEKSMYGKKYMGISRSHFVIDEQGHILQANPKISPEQSIEQAIKAIGR